MRPTPRYPVDRYLVENSRNLEMVNILGDDLWEPEPALRPEDEIILKKLHTMLRSTADDLKELSGELAKYHNQDKQVHVKTQPTPLDEEFNEKIHIEEVVSARFNNYKLVDKNPVKSKNVVDELKTLAKNTVKPKISAGTQSNLVPSKKVSKRLGVTPISIVQINETDSNTKKTKEEKQKLNNGNIVSAKPTVVYNEFTYEYVKPKPDKVLKKLLIQDMPSINIRSELKEQKVLQLDIMPANIEPAENTVNSQRNVAVISAEHAETPKVTKKVTTYQNYDLRQAIVPNQTPIRKVTKISTGESSISSNNISSASNAKPQSLTKSASRISPKNSARAKNTKSVPKKEIEKKIHFELDEWKRKLHSVYGRPSTSRSTKTSARQYLKKEYSRKNNLPSSQRNPQAKVLNNTEYIPYSKLTLGGAKVSDVEREISDLTHKDIPLSPILDKILSSQENTPRKPEKRDDPKVLTTSDENLLEEVLDLEKVVSQTLSVKIHTESKLQEKPVENLSRENSENADNESYADDFEDEQSENSENSANKSSSKSQDDNVSKSSSNKQITHSEEHKSQRSKTKLDIRSRKSPSLSIKKSVDVFECVHLRDTRETATQSNKTNIISLKETQTSPRPSRPNIHPIHNELWPSIDPKGQVEKMFQLEKDFIKKVILDEYGDLITQNLAKPSTSQENKNIDGNVISNQKNTQTSPAHVKCVMTSPTRTKTRTTSPFISVKVDKDTSPMVVVTNEEELTLDIDIGKEEDAISVNLSSPRFNLRLPNTSREVFSNLDVSAKKDSVVKKAEFRTYRKQHVTSSSSDGNYSSSELSSLGEVKLRKLLKKNRALNISESSSSSSVSKYSLQGLSCGILPLRSEGEVTNSLAQGQSKNSQGQTRNSQSQTKKKNNNKSEGEMSLRMK